MTVPSTQRRAGPFSGNGTTTSFPFTFKVFAAEDVEVVKTGTNALESTLVLNSDYSVSMNFDQDASPGGTITYPITGSPLAAGEKLTLVGNLEYEQTTNLTQGGAFSPTVIEDTFDRTVIQIQQLEEEITRALRMSVSTTASGELPAAEAGKLIGWDQLGAGFANYDAGSLFSGAVYADWKYSTFSGDGSTVAYALQQSPGNIANMDVSVGGVTQIPMTDYTLSGSTVNFTTAPPNGAPILLRYGQAAQQVSSTFSIERQTATASQTVFNLTSASYLPGSNNLAVYVNGLKAISGVDFTETDSDTVTFTSGLTAGDELEFVCGRTLNDAVGSESVSFKAGGTGAVTRSAQSKLRDVVNVMDFGAVGDGITDDTVAIQSALYSQLGISALNGVFLTSTGNLSPTAKTTVAGAGRENTFFRTSHASNSVFLSTAQFVTYRDMTIDRSGAVGGTGITHNAVSNLAPLEGLELDRVNINGHNFGISIRDLVLGGIRNSYIQAGGTGVDINNTGVNAVASFWMDHVWIRGNTTVGANIINCKQTRLQQVAFESAGGRTCPKGLSVIGGNAVYLGNCWFEALLFGAEFIGCGTVTFDGGYLDGSALTTRGFYAANSSGNTTVIFDGPWQVENLSVTFATADDNSTIIVRTPSLAAYTFQAINGGKVIYDFDYVKTQTYNPPSLTANGTTTVNVTVDGASAGDLVTVNFSDGTTDPNLFYWTGTVTGPNTVVVFLRNMHSSTIDLGSGTLTTRVRKRPLTS